MGQELLDGEGLYDRNDACKPQDDPDVRQDPGPLSETSKEKTTAPENLVQTLAVTLEHYFPAFNEALKSLSDKRDKDLIVYKIETIVWTALIALVTKRGARQKITWQMRTPGVLANLQNLCGQTDLEQVPHGDTVEYAFMRMKEEEIEEMTATMVKTLLRNRVLEPYRLLDRYHTVAIDAVHTHSFGYKHCDLCLVREDDNGKQCWMHYKLQASLVTLSGLCIPIAAEWIENESLEYNKQDCETKACKRLLKKIRRLYTQLPICVLLDGLYANQPMFEALKENRMEWIVVFKEGNNSESYPWVMLMKNEFSKDNVIIQEEQKQIDNRYSRNHDQRLTRTKPAHKKRIVHKTTTYTWAVNIKHWDGKRIFNVMTCKEVQDKKTNCDYVWLVSEGLNLSKDNVQELAKRGRCRWVIENQGFNTLKNGGYRLEHLYSRDPVSMKVWHRILDMAFLINQLVEKGSLITRKAFGGVADIAARMFEHFCYLSFRGLTQRPRIQIRLVYDSS